jgi:hypothetical protein
MLLIATEADVMSCVGVRCAVSSLQRQFTATGKPLEAYSKGLLPRLDYGRWVRAKGFVKLLCGGVRSTGPQRSAV